MDVSSLTLDFGFKHTFIKLEFKSTFGLTDIGPQEEEAVVAWEAVMHDIYFLGGPQPVSDTWWGRITDTKNEVIILTGLRGHTRAIATHPPLVPRIVTETTPNIFSPLTPYLLHPPTIINIQWHSSAERLQGPWTTCCDLNLFHIPNANEESKRAAAYSLGSCMIYHDCGGTSPSALESTMRGNLYQPEGCARSFSSENNQEWLRDSVTLAHLTQWQSRALAESYKDPARENEKWSHLNPNWYQIALRGHFNYAVEKLGVKREETRVELKKWMEVEWEEDWIRLKAEFPRGSIPTHKPHGKECESCERSRKKEEEAAERRDREEALAK